MVARESAPRAFRRVFQANWRESCLNGRRLAHGSCALACLNELSPHGISVLSHCLRIMCFLLCSLVAWGFFRQNKSGAVRPKYTESLFKRNLSWDKGCKVYYYLNLFLLSRSSLRPLINGQYNLFFNHVALHRGAQHLPGRLRLKFSTVQIMYWVQNLTTQICI